MPIPGDTLGHFPVKRILEAGAAMEEFRPHAIVISLDQEDIVARTPTERVETYLELMINHFAAHTGAKLVVVAPPPRPFAAEASKGFAIALGRFALPHNVELADLYEAVNLHGGDWQETLYVDDTVAGFVALAGCDDSVGEVANLASGRGVSVAELVDAVLALASRDVPVEQSDERVRPESSEVYELVGSSALANRRTGWTARTSFEDGLAETFDWISSHLAAYRVGDYAV